MTGDRRPRRAIRPMILGPEVLESRRLLTVDATAFLSTEVNLYWSYTKGLYGSFSPNTTNASGGSTTTTSGGGTTTTVTTSYNDSYSSTTTGGSSGGYTTTWNQNDTSTTTTTITTVATDSSGYLHNSSIVIVNTSNIVASGWYSSSSSSTTFTQDNATDSTFDDVATKGYETITAHARTWLDWFWSGSGTSMPVSPNHETLSAKNIGGGITFSDVIASPGGSPTTLNESSTYVYNLSAVADRGVSGITSSYVLLVDGVEDMNLVTTVTQGRVGPGLTGSDSSYLNENAHDDYWLTDSGGASPTGVTGNYTLNSNGSIAATRTVSGGGTTSLGASDTYNINDAHQSVFMSSDIGVRGPVASETVTDSTISSDIVTTNASGTTVRPGGYDGTGTDSYVYTGTTTLLKGVFSPTSPVYDTMTSGYNSSGPFSRGTLQDSGTDSETIRMYGTGFGTVKALPPGSSGSGSAIPVTDSYDESDVRNRSYDLTVDSAGNMTTHNGGTENVTGTSSFNSAAGSYTFNMAAADITNLTAAMTALGAYTFTMDASGSGPGGSYTQHETGNNSGVIVNTISTSPASVSIGHGLLGGMSYMALGGTYNSNSSTAPAVQRVGGTFTQNPGVVIAIDGSNQNWDTSPGKAAYVAGHAEVKGVSDPVGTNFNMVSLYYKTGFTELDTPLNTLTGLQTFVLHNGRVTSIYVMDHGNVNGPPPSGYDPRTDESELASPTTTNTLPAQGMSFLNGITTTFSTGGIVVVGGTNTVYAKGIVATVSSHVPTMNGVYVGKTHVRYQPGFLATDFYLTRGQPVNGDPFAE